MKKIFILIIAMLTTSCATKPSHDEERIAKRNHDDLGILLGYHYCKWSKWPDTAAELKRNMDREGLLLLDGKPDWDSLLGQLASYTRGDTAVLLTSKGRRKGVKFQSLHKPPTVCKGGVENIVLAYEFGFSK